MKRASRERASRAGQGDVAKRLEVINELMRIAASSLDIADVFDGVGEQIKRLVDFDRLSIVLYRPGEETLESYAFTADSLGQRMRAPLRGTTGGDAILSGRSILRRNFAEESPYAFDKEVAKKHGFRSAMFVPLKSKGRVIGVLAFSSCTPEYYSKDDVAIAEEVADHLAVIVEHTLLYEQSKEMTAVQERNRIAREIHDTLAQSLTGLIVQLETADQLLGRDVESARGEIRSAGRLARESLEEARRSIWDLQSMSLESGSLIEAIEGEVRVARESGIRTSVEVEGQDPGHIPQRMELAVLRILQEALNNAKRHSRAENVAVRLDYGPTELEVRITDDGVGFDPAAVQGVLSLAGGGFGLASMQERARLAGGQLTVRSAPGMGTEVDLEMPYLVEAKAPSAARPAAASEAGKPEADTIRVLIADDHEVARRGIRSMIEQAEDLLLAGEAVDGLDAIEKVRTLKPDVILMDLEMPRVDGAEAVRQMREEGLDTPVILVSVYLEDERIFQGLKAGASGYLTKDVGRDDLERAIRTVYEGGSMLQPVIARRLIERLDAQPATDLTERELDVLRLVASGARNKEIAEKLFLSVNTVRFHIANVFQKLGVQTRTEAVRVANERGLLPS